MGGARRPHDRGGRQGDGDSGEHRGRAVRSAAERERHPRRHRRDREQAHDVACRNVASGRECTLRSKEPLVQVWLTVTLSFVAAGETFSRSRVVVVPE